MPAFVYHAVDSRGKRVDGETEAPDASTLTRTLEGQGLLLIDVGSRPPTNGKGSVAFHFGKRREVLEVTRALASLLPAGLPLAQAIDAAAHMASGKTADAMADVRRRVERGEGLADALAQSPDLFPAGYVGLVRAGEQTGDLGGVFQRLADQLERQDALRARVVSASIYPMLLALLGGVAVVVLLLFVIPRFVDLLQDTGAALPRSTAFLLTLSSAVTKSWPLMVAAPFIASAGVWWVRSTPEGRRLGATLALRLPLVSRFRRNQLAAQFARTAGMLIGAGAPLVTALDDSIQSIADPIAQDETLRIRTRVHEGSALHEAIAEGDLYPPLLARLVAVGERSSRLPDFLLKAADVFEEKSARTLQRMATVIEPVMIVVFGSIVALVALSLLQAVYSVNAGSFR